MSEFNLFNTKEQGDKKMTNEEYFAHEALSASKIKQILDCPFNYFNNIEKAQTGDMEFGEKCHKLVLESDLEKTRDGQKIVVMPDFGKLTLKANKEAKEKFLVDNAENYLVTQEQFDCAKSVLESPLGNYFKIDGLSEEARFGKVLGRDFKCKADYLIPNYNGISLCIDLKFVRSINEYDFLSAVKNYGYHIQAYIYSQILGVDNFLFITVEKTYPYILTAYELDSSWADIAKKQIEKAFSILDNKEIYNKKYKIHGFTQDSEPILIQTLTPPAWLMQ